MGKVILLTGGSSGIGKETCLYLANKYKIYQMSRRKIDLPGVISLQGDITSSEDIKRIKKEIHDNGDTVEILINNAGFGISGSAEFTTKEEINRQLNVNFVGLCEITSEFLEDIRNNQGKIISISSVAGVIAIPFQSFYSASKSALNAYTLALANELRPFKVGVSALMLGDTKTGFTASRDKQNRGDDIYKGVIDKSVSKMEKDEQNGSDAIKVSKKIEKLIKKKHIKPLYTVGFSYKLLVILSRILPVRLVNYIVSKLYA